MVKNPKTASAREAEVQHLARQLEEVGLPDEVTRPIVEDMHKFARTGQGFSKTYRVPNSPLRVFCLLSGQAHITSHARVYSDRPPPSRSPRG